MREVYCRQIFAGLGNSAGMGNSTASGRAPSGPCGLLLLSVLPPSGFFLPELPGGRILDPGTRLLWGIRHGVKLTDTISTAILHLGRDGATSQSSLAGAAVARRFDLAQPIRVFGKVPASLRFTRHHSPGLPAGFAVSG